MIHTDGKRTITNAPEREPGALKIKGHAWTSDAVFHPEIRRGPQANGQQWNDDVCACGELICDSPAGDKCWDCFNFDPSDS